MTIKTIKRITCDDTGRTYEVVDGNPPGTMPQLWEIELSFRTIRLPGCTTEGHSVIIKKLVVERQLLVNASLVPQSQQDKAPPPARTTEAILLELLKKVGVVPNKEPLCSTEFLN